MRTFWFVAGAGAGIYLTVRARRAVEALTPDGIGDRVAALGLGAQLFREEVRAGMAEKETELRERLGLALDDTPALESASSADRELDRELRELT